MGVRKEKVKTLAVKEALHLLLLNHSQHRQVSS